MLSMSAGCIPVLADLPVSHEWVTNEETGIICDLNTDNPFEKIFKIDFSFAAKQNKKLILKTSTKEISTEKFYNVYRLADL